MQPAEHLDISILPLRIGVREFRATCRMYLTAVRRQGFRWLPIEPSHLLALTRLEAHHRDPFDHLLIAQSIAEDATFVSPDRRAALYPVQLMRCAE